MIKLAMSSQLVMDIDGRMEINQNNWNSKKMNDG